MYTYRVRDKLNWNSGQFSGLVEVYTKCGPSGPMIINFNDDKIEYINDDNAEDYCGSWNNAVVYIYNGIVKRLKVINTDTDIDSEKFWNTHYGGELDDIKLVPVSDINIWKEDDKKNYIV